jgi:hypothetical protein
MAASNPEPRNPFYIVLIVVGFTFVITAFAYAVVPVLEQKAREAGTAPPPSPIRDSLRKDGWIWLLVEAAAIVVLSLASMGYDRVLRSLKERREEGKILTTGSRDASQGSDGPSSSS